MDQTLSKLVGYLGKNDTRLACATAVILAELAPKEKTVVKGLTVALKNSDAARRPFLIEALGRIGTPEAAATLVPFIQGGGPSAQDALRAVAHAGAGAIKPLAKALINAPLELFEKLVEALARSGESQGFAALITELKGADEIKARALRSGIRNAISGLDGKGRGILLKQLVKALSTKNFVAHELSTVAAIELVGDLGEAEGLSTLTAFTGKKFGRKLRSAALLAIGKLKLKTERRGKLANRLLPLLDDSDLVHVVEPALAALKGAEIGAEHKKALQQLVNATKQEVREFAMKAMARQGSKRNINELIDCLEDPDRSVRYDAAKALEGTQEAAGPLSERLVTMAGGEACSVAAHVLKNMAQRIPAKVAADLAQAFVKSAMGKTNAASSDDPNVRREEHERRTALMSVCRYTETPILAEVALRNAKKLRQGGDPHRALSLLKMIHGVEGFGVEHRLEQAFSGLDFMPIDLSRQARGNSSNIRILEDVLGRDQVKPKALAQRVMKDQALSRKIKYILGHHFSERLHGERLFGKVILESLATNPRNDEGRQAKEKLVMEGLAAKAKRAKAGILEARAQILMAPADLAAETAAKEAKLEAKRQASATKAQKSAKSKSARKQKALRKVAQGAIPKPEKIKKGKKKTTKKKIVKKKVNAKAKKKTIAKAKKRAPKKPLKKASKKAGKKAKRR